MLKNKFIKVAVFSFLTLMAIWVAVPKVYIHQMLHHHHSPLQIGTETKVETQSTDDCDLNEYNKPVYFDLFKFISSFVPLKPQNAIQSVDKALSLSSISYAISLLRAPPVSE